MTTSAAACATCGSTLPTGATFCPGCGSAASDLHAEPDSQTLDRLRAALDDRYLVERELGAGGMAKVFLAQDRRHERPVAIKVLHPELAESMGAERFLREIRVAARLQHPHILSLYDSGEANGLLFYVMPFVQGESLRDRIDREQMLPIDDALGITLEVADALGHAHSLGIIHRDIKPENILLQGGHAMVADFGIARALSAGDGMKLTQTGTSIGTPLYMSPEQSYGEEVGPTSDLYSLACVSYEMLTGQPPFTGANARAIMARHTVEQAPGLRVVRDTIPEEVEEAILMALAKVPADRPQSAAQFCELLGTPLGATATRRATRSRYTSAPRVTSTTRPQPVHRRPAVLAAGATLLIGAVAAVWIALKNDRPAAAGGTDPQRVAVLYFDDLSPRRELAYLADGLTEGLIDALGEVRTLTVVSRGGVAQFRGSNVGRDSIARALGVGTLVRGSVEPDGDKVRVTVRLTDDSDVEIERASFTQPAANALAMAEQLAQSAARLVRSRLGREIEVRQQRLGTQNVDAWVLVQRAERLRKQADSSAAAGDLAAFDRHMTSADSILARAETLDARWAEPALQRGRIAYRRSRLALDHPVALGRWVQSGMDHIERAAALAERNPDVLELRGNLRYWKWLNGLEPEATAAQRLLAGAQADLELAVRVRPAQAGAWSTLSHLYNQIPGKSGVDINLAARNALEADAFLGNADVILQRLFFSSYDLGQFRDADHQCAEGGRRFPDNPRFTECRLFMLSTRGVEPDVARAWALADSVVAHAAPHDTAYQRLGTRLMVAAVLARAGQADSARRVVERSRGNAELDPTRDLANMAAFVYTLLGDRPRAIDQLKVYLSANPRRRASFAADPGWWFGPLADDPAFRQLVADER